MCRDGVNCHFILAIHSFSSIALICIISLLLLLINTLIILFSIVESLNNVDRIDENPCLTVVHLNN